jgi:hypothetical protein
MIQQCSFSICIMHLTVKQVAQLFVEDWTEDRCKRSYLPRGLLHLITVPTLHLVTVIYLQKTLKP